MNKKIDKENNRILKEGEEKTSFGIIKNQPIIDEMSHLELNFVNQLQWLVRF